MTLEILGVSVLWLFLFFYVIVASIDFGAGFFNAYSAFTNKQHILTNIIQRYLSPVWEVTNVFFVFFFVGIIGFFSTDSILLRDNVISTCKYRLDFTCSSWLILCICHIWGKNQSSGLHLYVWALRSLATSILVPRPRHI